MYHPQIVKVIELINQGEIGELISMKSNFGMNILTKRNFFGFKKIKKLNKENRIFNKELGGGVILDIGCYPVSLSTLVASQISRIDYNKVKVVNIEKYMRPNEVEIDASMELVFENNFRSNVSVSFTKKLGSKTNILGKKTSEPHGLRIIFFLKKITTKKEINKFLEIEWIWIKSGFIIKTFMKKMIGWKTREIPFLIL